ncbi:ATP-dependent DNA helicase [Renibacterium salmoninarum ATCC 33209]|uniref:DNA 3'-5' helicase n=1 Tax=Renibacterium salmoninarum (strain ATCC 33209 / DSM 20767 / JCM 11484 / NBRC 15589 / NCIMB 2235) TaxID=288705 RepID=A9WPI7_RENSM|nr:ATP-dependent DNA helicase [Renibacterium salmoninarum]ABY22972.1 ATP-dependent DNA helicase [Renibacterium salmoninarum ATCC 33209]
MNLPQSPVLRLVPSASRLADAPELSWDQAQIVERKQGSGPLLIWGAPGTGKSTVLIESTVRRVNHDDVDPAKVLLLAPSRVAAARLRDALSARLDRTVSTSPARSWASYAFDILRRAQAEGLVPNADRVPKLISGPEQDLFIRELLAGHALGLAPGPQWPEELHEALLTRGFRQEVRQLFDRIVDNGLLPSDLVELGRENNRPDWQAAAQLYREYRDLIELKNPGCYDPAGIVRAASELFDANPDWLARERERHSLILVDDLQETGRAVHGLLRRIGTGQEMLATACPDTVVQGFRGARPDRVGLVRDELGANEAVLSSSHRLNQPLAAAWLRIAERIAQSKGGHKARQLDFPADEPTVGPESEQVVSGVVVGSDVQQRRFVAERIMHFHVDRERPLRDMAVIVRTGAQVAAFGRYLVSHGIPVRISAAETPVRDEPAVRPLLLAYRVAVTPELLDAELAVDLLTSRIGGLSSVQIRRVRKLLRAEEIANGGVRGSDELLVEGLQRPAQLAALGVDGRAAARMATVLAAGSQAMTEPGANPQSVLWALWDATGLSTEWATAALREDANGSRADRDLDAMMALFQAAERYVEQSPAASPEAFVEYLLNQELPMDTLAARAESGDAVEVMTPASAAGRQWPVVIVAGLQEGVWPNNRLRGELLGSQYLVEVLELGAASARRLAAVQRMRDIRYDELRSFATAISRASERLICVGVSSEDEQPSGFLDLVDPWPIEDNDGLRPLTDVRRPKTLRALVAELRQANERGANERDSDDRAEQPAAEAARVLAELARNAVPGADPSSWWGLAPLSSTDPILPVDAVVPVSPSKIEAVHESALSWFLQAAGGEAQLDLARSLGTLIHGIAQDLPAGNAEELLAELANRWPALGLPENWETAAQLRRAERMLRKLAGYLRLISAQGHELVGVEQGFGIEVPGARIAALKGIVDRLELTAEGTLIVVDLKTGKNKPTAAQVEQHPQLGAYQVAAKHGAFEQIAPTASVGGAALVQLGDGTDKYDPQFQAPVDPEHDWATPLVQEAAVLMSAAAFITAHDPSANRNNCPLPDVCPLCRGKQVTQ